MDVFEVLRINVLSPMVLAFVLGIIAVRVKSDLEIPDQVYALLSIYLLFSIGLRGGFDLSRSSPTDFIIPALTAIFIGLSMPVWCIFILRRFGKMSIADAGAIAIHYGAVSSVTLSTCIALLNELDESFEGFMPAFYAVMELPAIAMALLITTRYLGSGGDKRLHVIQSALTGKGFLLLGGGVFIGYISGDTGKNQVGPFFVDLFPGMLTLFLLEMGTVVGKRLNDLFKLRPFLIIFAICIPIFHGMVGITLGTLAGLSLGGSMIMGTLAASSSYITAPATVRATLPQANPVYYLTLSLVITFPFNIVLGLPLYFQFASLLH